MTFYAANIRFVRPKRRRPEHSLCHPERSEGSALAPGVKSRSLASLGMTRGVLAMTAMLLLGLPAVSSAHDIPKSVTVLAFVKPDADHLRLVVRVPLEAIRDVDFPLRGPGYLELSRLAPSLPGAAKLWIADYVQLYENDTRLDDGKIIATTISLPSDRSFES